MSGGLAEDGAATDAERLKAQSLPEFTNLGAFAAAMGVSLNEVRFLAFHRKVSKTTHYRRFYMPKKTGGKRLISAPMPRLKAAHVRSNVPLMAWVNVPGTRHWKRS